MTTPTNTEELRAQAQELLEEGAFDPCEYNSPPAILALLDEIDQLREAKENISHIAEVNRDHRTALYNENTALKAKLAAAQTFAQFFITSEQEARDLIKLADETGISDIRDALIAVVFNDDGEEFLQRVEAVKHTLRADGETEG